MIQARCRFYVHCQTSLIADFREHYPGRFVFEGSRAVVFGLGEAIDTPGLRHCVAMALTYRLRKRARKPRPWRPLTPSRHPRHPRPRQGRDRLHSASLRL